ncbi:hypothetical protein LTR91_023620 [Friedmanniomyces endolithicus]|uniref:Mitochondrial carrier n=1 Tax=Friedmanniomyces endolithicus TaxID=329885 RepID=A0AAN6H697_9PEZI|nr:hypothetical protein LTR57_004719 [Friedmanniomyces endolithicus]KAK0953871.1 hypothetical protein LTR91_023620 [Friedmanniomyces endolithicus]KAK1009442.1 hypothetical protein LTS01_001933 [Friedmanniomyces endolithicus]KAK1046466.1 hypothetical protein LTS16_005820 [Friedmanniomyces endolithicus]
MTEAGAEACAASTSRSQQAVKHHHDRYSNTSPEDDKRRPSGTMDKQSGFPISTSREPNPLRPYSAYYREPTIGPPPSASPPPPAHIGRPMAGSAASISSTARDLLPELDIDLKTSAGEAWQNTRSLFDTLLYRYTSVLLAQPFDASKVVLQVSLPSSSVESTPQRRRADPRRQAHSDRRVSSRGSRQDESFGDEAELSDETEESDDIPDYFSLRAPRSRSPRKRRRTPPNDELSPTPKPRNWREQEDPELEYQLRLKRPDSITHAISALYTTSGAVGLWRATNCTFLYSALLRTTDAFLRSLLLAILGLPEISGPEQNGLGTALGVPGSMGFSGLDLSDSPNPLGSLIVVGLSSCITGLLLAPLDLIRTRLIVKPLSHSPRGLFQNVRHLPSLLAPSALWLPTALAHTLPQLFSASCPLLLRRQLKLTPESAPSLWSLAAFATCLTDLCLRLPLETIVRRAQVASLRAKQPELPMIVEPAAYLGVAGTVYSILYSEGERRTKDSKTGLVKIRRGQGPMGLVRGWKVGFWGLVGVWGAGALGPGEGKGRVAGHWLCVSR